MTYRLYLHNPDVVFQAQVAQSSFSYPLDEVTFDGVTTGAYTDIEEGFTVFFGSTAGDWDYGIQRVRKAATSTVLYIDRSSEGALWGEVDPVDNAYITVVKDARVWAKIPYIELDTSTNPPTSTTYMDSDLAVGTYTTNKPPIANGAGPAAQTIDSVTGLITVDFSANSSTPTTSGATISTYSWDVDDGTITAGTSTSRDITVTFPAGFRYVKLTVTDSNGQTHFTRIPVLARDPAADTSIDNFRITTHVRRRNGQEFEVQITESIPVGTYPPGTLAIVWNGEPATAADKSNIVHWGWLADERENLRAQRTGNLKDCTIQIKDVAGRLRQIPGFSISVTNAASPSTWTEMSDVTSNLMLHYLLQWFSTALEVTASDWFDASYLEHYRFNVDGATIWDMVDGLARKLKPDNYFTCDSLGELRLLPDPLLQATGDRTSAQQALTEADIVAISSFRRPEPQVHWWRAGAHLADYNNENTVFCIAPGDAPGQGPIDQENNIGLVASQAALNTVEGNRYALMNAEYEPFTIEAIGSTALVIEPAETEWVDLTTTTPTLRNLTFTNVRGQPLEVTINYNYSREGVARSVSILWQRETSGAAAITHIPAEPPPPAEYTPGDWYNYTPPTDTIGQGTGSLVVLTYDTLGLTQSISASSPSWSSIGPGGVTGLYDFVLDPFNPATVGYLAAEQGLYEVENYKDSGTRAWTQLLSATDLLTASSGTTLSVIKHVMASINSDGYLWLAFAVDGTDLWLARSTDGGATWNYTNIATYSAPQAVGTALAVGLVPRLVGGNHVLYQADGAGTGNIRKSTNGGSSFSLTLSGFGYDFNGARCVHCPYEGNTSGNIVWIGGDNGVHKSTDGGTSIAASIGATSIMRTGIEAYTQDSSIVAHWNTSNQLRLSTDSGASFSTKTATGLTGQIQATGGFPNNSQKYFALTRSGIFVSIDGGESFEDKTGDWSFGFTFNDGNHGVIVPDWTE